MSHQDLPKSSAKLSWDSSGKLILESSEKSFLMKPRSSVFPSMPEETLVYASERIPKYAKDRARGISVARSSWKGQQLTVEQWTNLLHLLFYHYLGHHQFTYGIYAKKEGRSFQLEHCVIEAPQREKPILDYLGLPLRVYEKQPSSSPELAVAFLHHHGELILEESAYQPPLFFLFLFDQEETRLEIHAKEIYLKSVPSLLMEGVQNILSFTQKTTEPLSSFSFGDLSCNSMEPSEEEKRGIIAHLEEKALLSPNAIALVEKDKRISFLELLHRINQMAHYLDTLCADEKYVGLMGKRSLESILLIFAIIKSGRAYVPIDESIPQNKLDSLCQQLNLQHIVISSSSAEEKSEVSYLHLQEFVQESFNYPQEYSNKNTSLLDTICVMQTSGTSGVPKIIEHNQVPIFHVLKAHHKLCDFKTDDCVGQRSPLQHIPSLSEFFLGAYYGIKTVIIPDEMLISGKKLSAYLNEHQVTWIQIVPTLMDYYFLREKAELVSLRYLVPLGEELKAEPYQQFKKSYPRIRVMNNYGLTECNTILLGDNLEPGEHKVPLGKAIDHYQVAIVNDALEPVPKGVLGQIVCCYYFEGENCIAQSKSQIQRGYIPKLHETMFLTGDYGNYLKGTDLIEYRGRKDALCKIHGKRVELLEIEQVIHDFEGVSDAKVLVDQGQKGATLLAFVVFDSAQVDLLALRKYLSMQLESYMIPEKIIPLQDLPKTRTGKINLSALKEIGRRTLVATPLQEVMKDYVSSPAEEEMTFHELGISSFQMMKLAEEIKKQYAVEFSVMDLYDAVNVKGLSRLLEGKEKGASSTSSQQEKIAVVGVSGLFPKNLGVNEFWKALLGGESLMSSFPYERREEMGFSEEEEILPGAYLCCKEYFDPLFFGISPREAKFMSLEQKYALSYTWKLLEDAGHTKEELEGKDIAVFIGVAHAPKEKEPLDLKNLHYHKLGTDPALISARVSYFFNWHGHSMTINTACSSSLVAVHEACRSIAEGSEYAVAGGIHLLSSKAFYRDTHALGIFSQKGSCRPYDHEADGILPGEAVGFVLLKPLYKAIEDQDHIYGVIEASGCNQDGKSNGITAPSGKAQTALLEKNLKKAGISPERIRYIESHGTGTKLGDPIEFQSMQRVLTTDKRFRCSLGSVKANVGHTIGAAGILSLIKACLSLNYGLLPPQIHVDVPNPLLDLEEPLYLSKEVEEISSSSQNIIAVNSFGYSGTNANVLLSPHERKSTPVQEKDKKYRIMLSAKTLSSFRKKVEALHEYLSKQEDLSMEDIVFTLNKGRQHFKEVAVELYAKDVKELLGQLERTLEQSDILDAEAFFQCQSQVDVPDGGRRISLPGHVFLPEIPEKDYAQRCKLDASDHHFREHQLEKSPVLAAGWMVQEVLRRGAELLDEKQLTLEHVYFLSPLYLESDKEILFLFKPFGQGLRFEIREEKLLATGRLSRIEGPREEMKVAVEALEELPVETMYQEYQEKGMFYGESYQRCKHAWKTEKEILLEIKGGASTCVLLDGVMHAMAYVVYPREELRIPYWIKKLEILSDLSHEEKLYALGNLSKEGIYLKLLNAEKEVLGTLEGLACSPYKKKPKCYEASWEKTPLEDVDHQLEHKTVDLFLGEEEQFHCIKGKQGASLAKKGEIKLLFRLKEQYKTYVEAYEDIIHLLHRLQDEKHESIYLMLYYRRQNTVSDLFNEALVSLLQVAVHEGFPLQFKLLSLPQLSTKELEKILVKEFQDKEQGLIYYDDGLCRKTRKLKEAKTNSLSSLFIKNETYLFLGGTGKIGRILMEHCVKEYGAHVLFTGRRALDEDVSSLIKHLSSYGSTVEYLPLDSLDYASFSILDRYLPKLSGVINCVGVVKDEQILRKNTQDAREVISTKMMSSINAYKYFKGAPLRWMVLFSSLSAEIGLMGQSDYAYANRFVDALAYASKTEFPIFSIAWGYWKEGGMQMTPPMLKKYLEMGLSPIENTQGCQCLDEILGAKTSTMYIY